MKRFKPGISFGDFVVTDFLARKSHSPDDKPIRDFRRGFLVWMAVFLAFGLLFIRLISLQIISGNRYRVLAEENRVRKVKLPAPRGKILDRNGRVLAENKTRNTEVGGVKVPVWERWYPEGKFTAHVVGTVGEVAEDEVGLLKKEGGAYDIGDLLGRSGLEVQYEDRLRGKDGGVLVEVDNQGKMARNLGEVQPEAGRDLTTTLDTKLQRVAMGALGGEKGAAVASVPGTGEVLALVSSPGFDPNTFNDQYSLLISQGDNPLFNRAIGGVYPPGSTFKMITTLAAIESGKVAANFSYDDHGIITVGIYKYTNWLFTRRGGVEGIIGFPRALTRSTDTFFYRVGELTGPEIIGDWAVKMGLGSRTGIDLPGEGAGLVPSPEWKMKTKGEQWYLGNTFLMAIGQDDVLATPVQMNQMTNVLATGGTKCRPHLISGGSQCTNVQISKETLDIIKKGMIGACSTGGTAYVFFDWNNNPDYPKVACKTGTAEYVADNGKIKTHGWLTAYAPADDPKISVTAVVEGGGEGSDVAAPIVRKMMADYFNLPDTYPYDRIPKGSGE